MANLVGDPPIAGSEDKVQHIRVGAEAKVEAIQDLWRMNITSATLYPDPVGLGESLGDWPFFVTFDLDEELELWPILKAVDPS